MALVAARYMFDGPYVIGGRLPALLRFLNRHGGQAGSGSATARRWWIIDVHYLKHT